MLLVKKLLLYVLVPATILYTAICIFLYFFQEKIIFHPELLPHDHAYRFGRDFEERNFEFSSKVKINALHFRTANAKGLVYYLHGNSGSLQSWGNEADLFLDNGYDVLMIDYRGFGKSTGKISQKALYSDANNIYAQLSKEYNEKDIVVYGRSIGSGIAAQVASKHSPGKLILEAPYYSFVDLSKHYYPWLPLRLFLRYQLRTDKFVQQISCPIVIFHGTDDKVVYHGSTEKLKQLLKPTDEVFSIQGGTHNDLALWEEYTNNLARILK